MRLLFSFVFATMALLASPDDPAQEVIAQMRTALGGAPKLDAIKSVSLEADLRRVLPADGEGGEAQDLSGDVTIDAAFPDRYLKLEQVPPFPGGPTLAIGTGLDGESAWRAPVGAPTGPNVIVRMAPARTGPGGADGLRRHTRAELTRLQIMCLGSAPSAGLTFTPAGQAEAPEGRADIVDIAGNDGFAARMFVDATTHRPLFLAYKTVVPRMHVVRRQAPHDAAAPRPEDAPRLPDAGQPPPEAEARMFVSDFKSVDGVMLPFKISVSVEGGPTEEWQIKKWKLNPALKPEMFKKS